MDMRKYWITLTDNERSRFHVSALLNYLNNQQRDCIAHGAQVVPLAAHTQRRSLDYWLRTQVARNADHPQASVEVIQQLCDTGLFVLDKKMPCPDTGKLCTGLRVVAF